jgi:hypothetical protein
MSDRKISLDVIAPDAIPYFSWDAPVTNAEVRRALLEGTEEDKIFWSARILREARSPDVWKYLSLRRDVLSALGEAANAARAARSVLGVHHRGMAPT